MYDFREPFCVFFAGLPQPEWKGLRALVLQGYFDDSGSDEGSPIFVLAGFIAPVDVWADFTTAWRATLNKSPPIGHLHMADANALSGEFNGGWSRSLVNQRVFEFVELIRQYELTRIHTAIKRVDFENCLRKFSFDPALANPYFFLFYKILVDLSKVYLEQDVSIQTFFDEQGVPGTNAIGWWDYFAEGYLDRFNKFDRPVFVDDRRHLPLQAADIYAWHLRRHLHDGFLGQNTALHNHIINVFADLPRVSLFLETEEVEAISVALQSAQKKAMRGEHPRF